METCAVASYDIIKCNADLLLRLINDILDMSRLESGRMKLDVSDCDIVDICKQALATVDISQKNDNTLQFKCDMSSFILQTDSQKLKQVIINLLSNASKFTVQGLITLELWIRNDENLAYFAVTDTGCGIDRKSTRMNSSHIQKSRMPSSA